MTNTQTITTTDVERYVRESLQDWAPSYDIDAIVADLWHGTAVDEGFDCVSEETFWRIVESHDLQRD